jgi:hypothetical protein
MPTLDEISDAIRAGDVPLHLAIQLDPATLSAMWNAARDPKELFRLIMWTCSAHTVIHQIIMPMTRRIVSDSADVGPWARPVLQHLEQALAEPNRREFRRRLTSDLGVIQRQDQMGTRPLARVLSVAKVAVERYLDDGTLADFAVVAPGRWELLAPYDIRMAALRPFGPPTLEEIVAAATTKAARR